ncbi:MFS transporter [Minwuia thermotolerans]|uniref:MFS transporter n=1 Tax=Minwuia thermotolerans TaxID=2056226 RepID=A0A2M9FZ13_9PROT|nr:MFS transporter [Minwuia thermotolerans]ANK80694.1 MAG: MFS transporter [Rhizobiales bacterium NRL2]PJK28679.1 MFS transporter [Minwuia thermotolerans]
MRGKATAIGLLCVAEIAALSVWFTGAATLPAIRAETQISDLQASLYSSMLSVGFVVGTLTSAILGLADRWRPQYFFCGAALLAGAANAAVAFLDPASPLVPVLRLTIGASLAGCYPVGMKMVSTWAKGDMGLLVGILVGALTLGSGAPHLSQAFLQGLDWRVTLYVSSAACVLAAALVLLVRLGPNALPAAAFRPAAVLEGWRSRALRLANFGYFGHMWELYAVWGWIAVFLHASFSAWYGEGDPRAGYHASLTAFGVLGAGAIGAIGAGLVADRIGRTTVTIAAMAMSAACCMTVGFLFGGPPGPLIALCLFWGVVVIADSAQFSSAVMELADRERVGTMVTAQTSLGFLLTLAPLHLLPEAAELMGWEWAFWIIAAGPLLGCVAMARLRAHPDAVRIAGGRR